MALSIGSTSTIRAQSNSYCKILNTQQSHVSYASAVRAAKTLYIAGTHEYNYRLRAFITALDAQSGDILWTLQPPDTMESTFTEILLLPDGTILAVGNWRSQSYQIGGVFMTRLDHSGTTLWSKTYTWKYYPYTTAVTPTGIALGADGRVWISAFKVFYRIHPANGQIEKVYALETGKVLDIEYDSIQNEILIGGLWDANPGDFDVFIAFLSDTASMLRAWSYGGDKMESLRPIPLASLVAQKVYFLRLWHQPGSNTFFFTTSTYSFSNLYTDIVTYPRLSTIIFLGNRDNGRPEYAKMLGKIGHMPAAIKAYSNIMNLLCEVEINAAGETESHWIFFDRHTADGFHITRLGPSSHAEAIYEGLVGRDLSLQIALTKSRDYRYPGMAITRHEDGYNCQPCTGDPKAPTEIISVIDSLQPAPITLDITEITSQMEITADDVQLTSSSLFSIVDLCQSQSVSHKEQVEHAPWAAYILDGHLILRRHKHRTLALPIRVDLYSTNGKILLTRSWRSLPDDKTLRTTVTLPPGVYFVDIHEGDKKPTTLRVVKL